MKTTKTLGKRILSLALSILMVLSLIPMSAFSTFAATIKTSKIGAVSSYDGVPVKPLKITSSNYRNFGLTASNWGAYNGYYGIRNAKELYGFANLVNGGENSAKAVVLHDIVVNETVRQTVNGATYTWTPIGNSSKYFKGVFDGNGCTISGLYYNESDYDTNISYIGLFGVIENATIKNVIISNTYFHASSSVAGIAAHAFKHNSVIDRCKLTDSVTIQVSTSSEYAYTGGFIGSYTEPANILTWNNKHNYIRNCVNLGKIYNTSADFTVSSNHTWKYTGSIAGSYRSDENAYEHVVAENCYYLSNSITDKNGKIKQMALGGTNISVSASDGCTGLNSASDSHTCVTVEHKEVTPTCDGYSGLSNYTFCLVCSKITSGSKVVTPPVGHIYKAATCQSPEKCDTCELTRGEKNSDNHANTVYEVNKSDRTKHDLKHVCCNILVKTEGHTFDSNNYCAQCNYYCEHLKVTNGACEYCGSKGIPYVHRYFDSVNRIVISSNSLVSSGTSVTSSTTSMSNGWYIVDSNVTVSSRISISGTVNILLCDGYTLTAVQGINTTNATLNIYGQRNGTGTLIATNSGHDSPIGGSKQNHGGTLSINGGTISATANPDSGGSGNSAAAIGGGGNSGVNDGGSGGTIVINGGTITAIGGAFTAGIGAGRGGGSTNISIHGGTITAKSGNEKAAGIGTGQTISDDYSGNLVITGGNIKSLNSVGSRYIGGSKFNVSDGNGKGLAYTEITINNATDGTMILDSQGSSYNISDIKTMDTNKLYFYLSSGERISSFTTSNTEYICNKNNVFYASHQNVSSEHSCTISKKCLDCGEVVQKPLSHNIVDGLCTICGMVSDENFIIGTAQQLINFAGYVNEGHANANAILTNDIDLSGYNWKTIAETGLYYKGYGTDLGYTGTFDGNGYVIKNLKITSSSTRDASCGLFGTVSGTIKNLGVDGVTFVDGGKDIRAAAIVGQLITTNGKVENCFVRNATIKPGEHVTGGIAGCVYEGIIENCYVVNSDINGTANRYGYIVGDSRADNSATDRMGIVVNCYSDNAINCSGNVGTIDKCETKTVEAFESGEVAYLLGDTFGQELSVDKYPVFYGDKVYQVKNCNNDIVYSNTNKNFSHIYKDGICTICDEVCKHNEWENGICTNCGFECLHEDYEVQFNWSVYSDEECYAYPEIKCSVCDSCENKSGDYAEITEESEGTDCENPGSRTFTYSFEYNGETYTDSKKIIIKNYNHTGNIVNGFCSACDGYEEPKLSDNKTPDDEYDDYYEIANAGQLYWFAEHVNSGNTDSSAKLVDDIVINEDMTAENLRNWTPIDNLYADFDGQGHTISGVYCKSDADYVGFFGYTGYYPIRNFIITNSYFEGSGSVGAIAGYNQGEISNCGVTDSVTVAGDGYDVALFVGHNVFSIKNSFAMGETFVGYSSESYGASTENCYYIGTEEIDSYDGTIAKTADAFKSGEVAYLLQGEQEDDVWGQKIGTDKYPVIYGDKVYYGYDSCAEDAVTVYSNNDLSTDPNFHDYGEWKIINEATYTQTGLKERVCDVCKKVESEIIPMLDKKNGIFEEDGVLYYYVNNAKTYAGLILIDGYYYYVNSSCKVITNNGYYISKTNNLLPRGSYKFDVDGKMIDPPTVPEDDKIEEGQLKNGFVRENGVLYYYVNDVKTYAGLIKVDGYYYYVNSSCKVIANTSYYVSKTNNLLPGASYKFDGDGKMTNPPTVPKDDVFEEGQVKNGFVRENGALYYYVNDVKTYAGLIKVDGYYYYVNSSCKVITNTSYYASKTNNLLPGASYKFDSDGKMIDPPTVPKDDVVEEGQVKNGFVRENGNIYYYVNGEKTYAGLIKVDGDYYYVNSSCVVVTNRTYYVSETHGICLPQTFTFDENGKILEKVR